MLPSIRRLTTVAARVLLKHILKADVAEFHILKSPFDADYFEAL